MDSNDKLLSKGIPSKSQSRRLDVSLGSAIARAKTRIKLTDDGQEADVSVGKNVVHFSLTRLGFALTPRRADLLGRALVEAAKLSVWRGKLST